MALERETSGKGGPAVESASAVSIRSVRHRYKERLALDGVSLDVPERSIFGLLGPNGGGKTTLFRLLSTAMPLQEGSIELLGRNVMTELFEVRRRIGVVFQSPSLDPKLSVEENLTHHARLYGIPRGESATRIRDALSVVGLTERASERVEKLSGGLARRAELAKGLLHRPALLILDEPSTGLDPAARSDLWRYLVTLPPQGVTVLTTTHLMEEAERCDHVAILDQGKIVAVGDPESLREEIGGEVVTVETTEPDELAKRVREKLGVDVDQSGRTVRFSQVSAYHSLASIVEMAGPTIVSINVARPTLEDVFLKRTGHRFWGDPSVE